MFTRNRSTRYQSRQIFTRHQSTNHRSSDYKYHASVIQSLVNQKLLSGTWHWAVNHQPPVNSKGTGHDMHQLMGTDYWVPTPAWRLSCSVTKSYEQIVRTLSTEGAMRNLVKIAQAVSEKKIFKNYTFFYIYIAKVPFWQITPGDKILIVTKKF